MAIKEGTIVTKHSPIVDRALPTSLLTGEAIVNTANGIMYYSGVTTSTNEWTPAGTGYTCNFFEVGSNLYNLKIRNQITSYSGITNLSGKFLSGTTNGFVLADISNIQNNNTFTTGGTYNSISEEIDFTRNDGVVYSVNVSELLDDTNTFTTGATLNNSIIEFNRNDLSNAYSVDLSPLKFTGNTSADCITDLYVTNLNSCSPLHIQPINNGDVYISESGGFVGIGTNNPITTLDVNGNVNISNSLSAATFYGDGSNLVGVSSDNFYTTGGTYNPLTESIDFNGNSSATTFSVDVSELLDDTNTYTTGATLNNNVLQFNRNDLTNAYSVDLSSLSSSVNYSNVVFVDAVNGNDITAQINNFTKPSLSVSQGVSLASALPGLSSDNRALVYIRRGNYVNPVLFLQNNVDVYCEPGVVFTNNVQIRDNGVAVNSNIYGKLKINSNGTPFRVTGASSILFEFDSIVSNAAAIEVEITDSNNNIRIIGNSILSNTLGQGYGLAIRRAANVTLNISEKIEAIHSVIVIRSNFTGNLIVNCPNINLIGGNIYGGNFKHVIYIIDGGTVGNITINGNLNNLDTLNYGGITSVVRFWESASPKFKINGDINAGVIPGIVLSNGAGTMVMNGNVSSNNTCISAFGSNKLILNNGSIVRNTTTVASPFSIGGSSEVFINNSFYYSAFFGSMINIDNSNNAKLYLNNLISEGFIDITGTTGTFINTGVVSPTIGLNNVSTNRDYDTNINTSYLINLNVDPNIIVPKLF